jgi:GntR family transcriptional repressor for pyruvate dehydrogenase complex
MGVSRPTVREAIRRLVTMGLLEHQQGAGTFVRSLNAQREHNPLAAVIEGHDATLEELLEVRMGLEGQAALLAAQRASAEDLQVMEKALVAMQAENAAGRLGIDNDVSFHMALAFASKNPVQVYIMKNFYDLLHHGIKENLQALWEEPESLPIIAWQHREIYEAIKDHDPEGAYQSMKRHITFVLDFVRNRQVS